MGDVWGHPWSPPRRCLEHLLQLKKQCLQMLPDISWEAKCFPTLLGNTDLGYSFTVVTAILMKLQLIEFPF